jgi:hypothetical protein
MSEIRKKLESKVKGFGSTPPNWTSSGLGKADRRPSEMLRDLGVGSFRGKGEDWLQDIYDLLRIVVKSRILQSLYSEPIPYRAQAGIGLTASQDLYSFSVPVMLRMIKSVLWAAEQVGIIAMPSRLAVDAYPDGKGVWVHLK